VVKQWHDEVKPDYIFLTETSAIPFGYVLKEAWKVAYANKEIPKFYRVDPSFLMNATSEINSDRVEQIAKLKDYFSKLIDKINPSIIVFDEGAINDSDLGRRDQRSYDDFLYRYSEEDKKEDEKKVSKPNFQDIRHTRSLYAVMKYLDLSTKDKNSVIWGSQQTLKEILVNTLEPNKALEERMKAGAIPGERLAETEHRVGAKKSRRPTSKNTHSLDRYPYFTEDELFLSMKDFGPLSTDFKSEIKGRIVKHPEQRKRAIEYVNELQELGREAGEQLRVELEKKKEEGGN
jgi:hypothetical protein